MKIKHCGKVYTITPCWCCDQWWRWNPTATSWSPPFAKGFIELCDNLLNKQVNSSEFLYRNERGAVIPLKLIVKTGENSCKDITEIPWLVEAAAKQMKARMTRLLKKGRRERKKPAKCQR